MIEGDNQVIFLLPDHLCNDKIATKAASVEREHKKWQLSVEGDGKFWDILAVKLP